MNSASTGQIFMKFDIWVLFKILSRKFKFHWNLARITGSVCEVWHNFVSYLTQFFLEWEMLQTKVVEKINTYILCSITFGVENFATYETMCKNTVEAGRPQMTIWCKCIAWWIPKSTKTHTHTHTHSMSYLLLFRCNNGCTIAPQCYVTGTLPVLLFLAAVVNPEDNTMND